jgi:phage shock protein PspC (stress-responsive transcriptional regulator)
MNKLYRYPNKGYLGGVCYGFAVYTKTDPIIWRILAIFAALGMAYLVFWLFLEKG